MPYKHPLDNARYAYTAARYNQPFDLDEVARAARLSAVHEAVRRRRLGRRLAAIRDSDELHAAYDASGERLMHLQQSVEGYDVFVRSLSIGPETMVMKFRPELPMHDRYAVDHDFLVRRPATRC